MYEQESLAWRERYGHLVRTDAKTPEEEVERYREWYAARIGKRIGHGYEVTLQSGMRAPQDVRFTIWKKDVTVGFVFPLRRKREVYVAEERLANAFDIKPFPEQEFRDLEEILRKI